LLLSAEIISQPVMPMLAKPGKLPVNPEDYGFEVKWDGLRAIAYVTHGQVVLYSRNLKDITSQYPEMAKLSEAVGESSVTLDGELVAMGQDGLPSFSALQHRMGLRDALTIKKTAAQIPVTYMIFDLLSLNGVSLLSRPYSERQTKLQELQLNAAAWQTPVYYPGEGALLEKASKDLGLEGIVAKRLDSSYEAGKRSGAWLKIKHQHRQELLIAGWIPGNGARSGRIGAILTGYYDVTPAEADKRGYPPKLIFAGKVGTGFSDSSLAQLAELFQTLTRPGSPFHSDLPYKQAIFLEPRLVGEFEFTEWTDEQRLRHPSFKGLRTDKNPTEVIRE